jgi:hypothetical protein
VVLYVVAYQRGVEGDNNYGYSYNHANALYNVSFYGDYDNNSEARYIQYQYKVEVSVAKEQHLLAPTLYP